MILCNVIYNLEIKKRMPLLSIIVIFYNMKREAPRTLYTLSSKYQLGVSDSDYEVLVIDNGSDEPLGQDFVESFGPNFHLIRRNATPSPASAINTVINIAQGNLIMICIDGARMLSPGIIKLTLQAFNAYKNPIVATPAYHLGPKLQNDSIAEGYCQDVEDSLLNSIPWKENGYSLFSVCVLAGSSRNGWFLPLSESNCLALSKNEFLKLNGYSQDFKAAGGGFINLDFYKRACESIDPLILLLGEGTFHQVHGGVATNAPRSSNAALMFHNEYVQIRGKDYTPPINKPIYWGQIPGEAVSFLHQSTQLLVQYINNPDSIV